VIAFPKPRPRALQKLDRQKAKQSVEDRENSIVKTRSGGRCEVATVSIEPHIGASGTIYQKPASSRCVRRASEIHHLLSGMGRRGVKESALAQNKQHVCGVCHDLITRHILQGYWTDVKDRASTITYIRLR
jgi:hypothetical protein